MGISISRIPITGISIAILVRWLVGTFPYSGQATPPMFGDYEAQRHWMEITTNLPIKQWYNNNTDNDLQYWGLDYPPLTAYHMYALGHVSKLVNQSWTELHHSRGLESPDHKLFMRLSVLISDVFLYMPAILYYFHKIQPEHHDPPLSSAKHNAILYSMLIIMNPTQILVDHGHFQYNCVFMALTLWAVIFMCNGRQRLSALSFTLALTYKQMSFYYSLPFFWYIASSNLRVRPLTKGMLSILSVGSIVSLTFGVIMLPWLQDLRQLNQIAHRVFPFYRGVFEDKVANLWFCASVFYKYRGLYPPDKLIAASTVATLVASLPAGLHILARPSIRSFKYALVNTSLAFFLLSFQVHEKTILVPALPILLLIREHPMAVNWFVTISTLSLQPLLEKDGQTVPFLVLMVIFTILTTDFFKCHLNFSFERKLCLHNISIVLYISSLVTSFTLIMSALFIKPPSNLPHLHATINALYSCSHFVGFLIFFYVNQFRQTRSRYQPSDTVQLDKKTK